MHEVSKQKPKQDKAPNSMKSSFTFGASASLLVAALLVCSSVFATTRVTTRPLRSAEEWRKCVSIGLMSDLCHTSDACVGTGPCGMCYGSVVSGADQDCVETRPPDECKLAEARIDCGAIYRGFCIAGQCHAGSTGNNCTSVIQGSCW